MTTSVIALFLIIGILMGSAQFVYAQTTDPTLPVITEIINDSGDGSNGLTHANAIASDSLGNVYVAGEISHNVFKITPSGEISEIIDSTGDGSNPLSNPYDVTVDSLDNVYVVGAVSHNVFKITPDGIITEIINDSGDGSNLLNNPFGLTVDSLDNVYVFADNSDNIFKITPGGEISEIINGNGDGINSLNHPRGLTSDSLNNIYISGADTNNVFKITPDGEISEIIDSVGSGDASLDFPFGLTSDSLNNVYVTGANTNNVFKITQDGIITEIIDSSGDGTNILNYPLSVTVDSLDNVYVVGTDTNNAFKITPDGTITQIIDSTVDGGLTGPYDITVDSLDNIYVAGINSDNAFKITFDYSGIYETLVDTLVDTSVKTKKGGGGNEWDTRPTFGLSHDTYRQQVDNGFSFNYESFQITDNWHTPFAIQNVTLGAQNFFTATVYAEKKLMVQEFLFGIPIVGESRNAELGVEVWYNHNGEIIDTILVQQTNVVDPDTFFAVHNKVKCLDSDDIEKCDLTLISMVFLEPLKDDVMSIQATDFKRRSHVTFLNEGFNVDGNSLNPMIQQSIPGPEKYEGVITVTQASKYSNIWIAKDGRIFESNYAGTFKQINKTVNYVIDSGEAKTRTHSNFTLVQELESDKANQIMIQICNSCNDVPFDKINDIFAYEIVIPTQRSDDVDLQQRIHNEAIKAADTLDSLIRESYTDISNFKNSVK